MSKDNNEIAFKGWHLRKEVTVGQIVTLLVLLVSGVWWASSVETRFAASEAEDKRIEQKTELYMAGMTDRFDRYQSEVARALSKIDYSINRLSDKIDHKKDRD